eukprot:9848395-Ditylum_brightwellii.AAC.1
MQKRKPLYILDSWGPQLPGTCMSTRGKQSIPQRNTIRLFAPHRQARQANIHCCSGSIYSQRAGDLLKTQCIQ